MANTMQSGKPGMNKREQWSKDIDFLFSCLGLSVGLGNVWRFPFLCYRNGGGAFLIPYIIFALFIGVPLVVLEVCLGQFTAQGGLGTWKICPLFQGIGMATSVIVGLLSCNYIVVLAWAFYYLFASFTSTLPWSHCNNTWNTDRCSEIGENNVSQGLALGIDYGTNLSTESIKQLDPVTEFWENKVLGLTNDITDPGSIKWDLTLCLLLAWVMVYLCLCKGIKTSGKVMYVTATSPYILIVILLVRGLTLEGATKGIEYYLLPKWEKVKDLKVWVDAGSQVYFSYAISNGTLTALGSYNKFGHNCIRDSVVLCCMNSLTSFLAGFVIFSTLGFMAHRQNVHMDDVAGSGPGLIFIVYPEAIAQMPAASVWAVLFFCMVILLGIDSQIVGVEAVITTITDLYPQYIRVGHRKEIIVGIICCIFCLIGLSMVTHGGIYVFQLFDFYSAGRITLLVGFLECTVVAWIYGADRFLDNIQMMTGMRPATVFKPCWLLFTPICTLGIFSIGATRYTELTYKRKYIEYHYPQWAICIGWMLALCSVICVPLVMAIQIPRSKGNLFERIRLLVKPILKRHQLRTNEDLSKIHLGHGSSELAEESHEVELNCIIP